MSDTDDDWTEPEKEIDDGYARCPHGMPKWDCDWCGESEDIERVGGTSE